MYDFLYEFKGAQGELITQLSLTFQEAAASVGALKVAGFKRQDSEDHTIMLRHDQGMVATFDTINKLI